MQRDPRPRGAAAGFSFESALENEGEILDGMLAALVRNQVPPEAWLNLHAAAVRDQRSELLIQAYALVAQGKRIKAAAATASSEFLYQAGVFLADEANDPLGAIDYWQRALIAMPTHMQAFGRLESALIDAGQKRAQAQLYISQAHQRPRAEQPDLLRRAVIILEGEEGTADLLLEQYQEILRLDPRDDETRIKLEASLLAANRPRDVARLLEQTLVSDPPPEEFSAREIRGRLIQLYAGPLGELERTMPHVEALLAEDPEHDEARTVAHRLLEVRALAGRAAGALAVAMESTGTPSDVAKILAIELEHTRGPKRRDVLRRLGILRQERLGDDAGAFEAYEQALVLDASDEDVQRRYVDLATLLGKQLDAARTLSRLGAATKDAPTRARLAAEVGDLYLSGGDPKRGRVAFVGVLSMPELPPEVQLRVSRALCAIYASERDFRSLADSLERVAALEPSEELRQTANEELAELAQNTLRDAARAIAAWRRLVDTPARQRALDALEPLYSATGNASDLAFVLEERSKDLADPEAARALAFRAAEVLTTKGSDPGAASDAWARWSARFGPDRSALAAWIPLLEAAGDWQRLSTALEAEASLAPEEERARLFGKLGQIRLQRTHDLLGAIEAFASALATSPTDPLSRGALEKLATSGGERLAAARVLEPYYRGEENTLGILRVLDLIATLSDSPEERVAAIEEALGMRSALDAPRAAEWIARGLREAVVARGDIEGWIDRLVDELGPSEAKKRAVILSKALGDLAVDSPSLSLLATRAAEAYVASREIGAALQLYRRALAYDPTSAELIACIDGLLSEQGSPAERVALYSSALARAEDAGRRTELLHAIATIQRHDMKDGVGAIATYEAVLAEQPGDPGAISGLSELYAESERWDSLLGLLERALSHASDDQSREMRARMSEVALKKRDPGKARDLAESVLADAAAGEAEMIVLERVASGLRDTAMQRSVIARRVLLTPDVSGQIEWLERQGEVELSAEDPEAAVLTWKRAAMLAESEGNTDLAERLYERVRTVAPDDNESAFRLSLLLEKKEEWARLPELYAVMLAHSEIKSARIAILMRHARLLAEHLDDVSSALVSAAQAFELASASSEYRDVLSTFTMLALRGKATHIFGQAIDEAIGRHGANDVDSANRRADLRMAKARVLAANREGRDGAVLAYRAILEDAAVGEAQQKAALHAFDSLLASEAGDARRADRRWLFAWRVEHSAERAAVLEAWAQTEEASFGEVGEALALYKRSLAFDPENVRVLSAIARLSLLKGDADAAVEALLAQRDRSDGEARQAIEHDIAATYLHRLDRPEDALVSVARLLQSSPEDLAALDLASQILAIDATRGKMAEVLESAEQASQDAAIRARILRVLLDALPVGVAPEGARRRWYDKLLEIQQDDPSQALSTVLFAASEEPEVAAFWDRAEELARELERPREVADAYARALSLPLAKEAVTALGERGVAFQEEWFEDTSGVVRILERVLDVDPQASWAFDRLKLLFDREERWQELFLLYDRAILHATDAQKAALYEDAAQIAKDFANDSDRAVLYLAKLLELRPNDAHLVASLERLYERKGAHKELILLLRGQRASQSPIDAQRTRARIAQLWLDELKDTAEALHAAEEILANESKSARSHHTVEAIALIERIMAASPRAPSDSETTGVRYRSAAILRSYYEEEKRDADLARILEIELEVAGGHDELLRGHRRIADLYTKLGERSIALEHVATLALLAPEIAAHREELKTLASDVGRFDRLADVLLQASAKTESPELRAQLMVEAGEVWLTHLSDDERAGTAYLAVLSARDAPSRLVLHAARQLEPILERTNRSWDLLDVLERLATLEETRDARARAWTLAARLATSFGENARGILAWEARLSEGEDGEARDSLIDLLDRESRWDDLLGALAERARLDRPSADRHADRVRIAKIRQDRLGDVDAAIADWAAAEEEFGATDESTDALATLFAKAERWDELKAKLALAALRADTDERRAQLLARQGDIARLYGENLEAARLAYTEALESNPGEPVAQAGLLALAEADHHPAEVAGILLRACEKRGDWSGILALTPLRMETAAGDATRVEVLLESAKLAEERAEDVHAAFHFVQRAFEIVPDRQDIAADFARLAEATGNWVDYVAAAEAALQPERLSAREHATFGNSLWRAAFRHALARVKEERLHDDEGSLTLYDAASREAPADTAMALSVVEVAARLLRWSLVSEALVRSSGARSELSPELVDAVERVASSSRSWTELLSELTQAIMAGSSLHASVARDLEAKTGEWHRDRRGDPEAAESAFARALLHDPSNTEILTALAALQRRAKGRPLVESLLRLSDATGGDLELLREAADVAISALADRGLAKSILTTLLTLAESRWRTEDVPPADDEATPPSIGPAPSPAPVVRWALEALVRLYDADGQADRTIGALTTAARLPWQRLEARELLHRAASIAEGTLGDVDNAIAILEGLVETDPMDAPAVSRLVQLYVASSRHAELLRLRARLVEVTGEGSERVRLRLESASLELTLGHPEAAVILLRANLADVPGHEESATVLASVLDEGKRFAELADLYASQGKLAEGASAPAVAASWWVRAAEIAERRLADRDAAVRYYRKAIASEESSRSLDELARLLAARGDHAEAADTLARLLSRSLVTGRAPLTLRLVEELVLADKNERARKELEDAVRATPDEPSLSARLVGMYTSQGAWDALAELHREGAERAIEKPAKLLHLRSAADLFIRRSTTPDAAIPLLEEAIVLDPDDRAMRLMLGDALVRAGKIPEGRALIRGIIDSFGGRRPKERGVAHYHLALLEIATGNRAQALVELEAATKIDPGNARILRTLAELAQEDGQIDRAERSYRALLVALKRPEDSTEDAEVVRSEVLLALSSIAASQNQTERAQELIESALESGARSLVEARRLESALAARRDFPTLVRALEARLPRATSDTERVEVLSELARVEDVELGHLAAAFDARQKVLALTPASPSAHDASVALARRVGGLQRYVEDTGGLAEAEERAQRPDNASAMLLRAGRVVEQDLSDDTKAALLYERALAIATPPLASEGAPVSSSKGSRQGLAAIRALDPVYARLGKHEERQRLLATRVALEAPDEDPVAAADARFCLAEMTAATPDGVLDAGRLITEALALDKDLPRAERIVRLGLEKHPTDAGLLDLLESIGRNEGHDAALLDALAARIERAIASADVVREATLVAHRLGDKARAEALLTTFVGRDDGADLGWAFEALAALRVEAGDLLGSIEWKKREADAAEPGEARKIKLEVARLTDEGLGDHAAAAAAYEALFEEDPTDDATATLMMDALRRADDAEGLVRVLPRVADQVGEDAARSRLRFERIRLMVDRLGQKDLAIEPLKDLVMDDPNHEEAGRLLADLFEQAGRTDDLLELLGRQIDAAKDRQDAKAVEAMSLRRAALVALTDAAEARAILYSALDWMPESHALLHQLAGLLDEPGLESERLDVRERLLKVTPPEEVEALALELSALRTAEGNTEGAVTALEIAFRINPKSRKILGELEATYRASNSTLKLAELKVVEARGLSAPGARVAGLREAAALFAELPDPAKTAAALAEALQATPTDLALVTELVAALVLARDLAGATKVLTDVLLATEEPSRRASLLLERAHLWLDLNQDNEAATDLTAVARLGVAPIAQLDAELERVRARAEARGDGPIERAMRLELATVRAESGDLDGARPLLTELLRREPKDRDALRLLARIEERAERWDAATVAYRRLIPLEEGDLAVDTALRLADACERAGRLADARGALERTRTQAPHDQALRLRLERLYESVGAFRELAEMSFNDARQAADDAARCLHLKRAGALLLQDGTDTDAAIDALVEAQSLSTGDIECALLLADAYTIAGKTAEAQALITGQIAARSGRRSPEVASLYHRLARVATVVGDRDAELSALTAGLEADAQNGFVAAELASAALEAGNIDAATRALRAVTLLKDPSTSHISKGLAYQYLGEIARQQGDSKRAMLLLKRAIEDDPELETARRLIEELRTEGA